MFPPGQLLSHDARAHDDREQKARPESLSYETTRQVRCMMDHGCSQAGFVVQ